MNSLVWKRRLGRLLDRPKSSERDVILIYHSVGGGPLSLPEHNFKEQMNWLHQHASVVALDELLSQPNSGELRVALSFDDGYRSLHDTAHPILRSHGFPAIVYLNSGLLGESEHMHSDPGIGHYPDEQFMTWDEVSRLIEEGWTAGGHGVEHVDLTLSNPEETRRQLSECKSQIEARLGVRCAHFAYTWGHSNPLVRAATAVAGYASGVSGLHGPVSHSSDRFALPRIDIRAQYTLGDFADAITGRWDYLGFKQKLASAFS